MPAVLRGPRVAAVGQGDELLAGAGIAVADAAQGQRTGWPRSLASQGDPMAEASNAALVGSDITAATGWMPATGRKAALLAGCRPAGVLSAYARRACQCRPAAVRRRAMVRTGRLELPRVAPLEPKSSASTNSATFALGAHPATSFAPTPGRDRCPLILAEARLRLGGRRLVAQLPCIGYDYQHVRNHRTTQKRLGIGRGRVAAGSCLGAEVVSHAGRAAEAPSR